VVDMVVDNSSGEVEEDDVLMLRQDETTIFSCGVLFFRIYIYLSMYIYIYIRGIKSKFYVGINVQHVHQSFSTFL
jgi:hypothetical protein